MSKQVDAIIEQQIIKSKKCL